MKTNKEILNSYHAFEFENNNAEPKMFNILSSASDLFFVPDNYGVDKVVIHFSEMEKAVFNEIKINNEIFIIADFFNELSFQDNRIEIPLNNKTKTVDIQFTVDGNCKGRVSVFYKEKSTLQFNNQLKQLPRFTCVIKNISDQKILVDLSKIFLGTEKAQNLKYKNLIIDNEDGIIFDEIICASYNKNQQLNIVNFMISSNDNTNGIVTPSFAHRNIMSYQSFFAMFYPPDPSYYSNLFKWILNNSNKEKISINVNIEPNTTVIYSFQNKQSANGK